MTEIVPFSIDILTSLSIVSIATNVFNNSISMALNIGQTLEKQIQAVDNAGAFIKPSKNIQKLRKFNYSKKAKVNFVLLSIIIVLFVSLSVICSFYPESKDDFKIYIYSNGTIEIANYQNSLSYQKFEIYWNDQSRQVKSELIPSNQPNEIERKNVIASSFIGDANFNALKVFWMFACCVISWLLILSIVVSFALMLLLSRGYLYLLKKQ